MLHIWACTCGEETECQPDDLRLGSVWHCDGCGTDFGCVAPKRGGKAWIEIKPDSAAFNRLFEEPEPEDRP